ncbi:hypothetical protein CRG98_046127 [Punica granatum]|uniref:Uncharacterized protein n=1 Tax=Punica granatum TaxID=22663 RepID=A0A2I0HP48_PUNGR|nr:hypothetical protein CRG98_046127 [Punica granatum]
MRLSFSTSTCLGPVEGTTAESCEEEVVNLEDLVKVELNVNLGEKQEVPESEGEVWQAELVEDDIEALGDFNVVGQHKVMRAALAGVTQAVLETDQFIHCLVNLPGGGGRAHMTFVYGSNSAQDRRTLWKELQQLSVQIGGRWVLLGDYNAVPSPVEVKAKERKVSMDSSMVNFEECLSTLNLFDHRYVGCHFTRSNKRSEGFQVRKLDRVLINEDWLLKGLSSTVEFLAPGISDHSPALLVVGDKVEYGKKPFKFYNYRTDNSQFFPMLEKGDKIQDLDGIKLEAISFYQRLLGHTAIDDIPPDRHSQGNCSGSLVGYFPGGRGVRWSLSPYLFVLALACLSRMLDSAAREGLIGHHPQRERLKITHLCFADNLFMFSNGTLPSIRSILRVLERFHSLSGLRLNPEKTEFFYRGLSLPQASSILDATGLKRGLRRILPVRYLGVPLTSGSLWVAWVHAPLVKGRNIWSLKIPRDCSWSWRKILQLRSTAQSLREKKGGDGSSISFWFRNGRWQWPRSNDPQATTVQRLAMQVHTEDADSIIWKASRSGFYTTSSAWDSLKPRGAKVSWAKAVWFHGCAPRKTWPVCRHR